VSTTLLFPQVVRFDVSLQLSTAQVWHLRRPADLADELLTFAEREMRSFRAAARLGWQGSCVQLFTIYKAKENL